MAGAPEALRPLLDLSGRALVALVLTSAAALVLQGAQFGVAAWVFGLRLRAAEWLGLTCLNNLLTYALPVRGGTIVRAGYLNRVHAFPVASYAALTVSSHVLIIGVVSVVGMAGALDLAWRGARMPAWVLAGFVGAPIAIGVGGWLLAALGDRVARFVTGWSAHADAFRTSLVTWAHHPGRTAVFVGVTVAVALSHAGRLWVALRVTGVSASVPAVLLLHAAAAASVVVSVTPANLGTREAVLAAVSLALGLDPRTVVVAALIERAVAAVEAALGSAVFSGVLGARATGPPT